MILLNADSESSSTWTPPPNPEISKILRSFFPGEICIQILGEVTYPRTGVSMVSRKCFCCGKVPANSDQFCVTSLKRKDISKDDQQISSETKSSGSLIERLWAVRILLEIHVPGRFKLDVNCELHVKVPGLESCRQMSLDSGTEWEGPGSTRNVWLYKTNDGLPLQLEDWTEIKLMLGPAKEHYGVQKAELVVYTWPGPITKPPEMDRGVGMKGSCTIM